MALKDELYVTTLAQYKHINLAAKELFISPSALSMYIQNLEKHLGTRLFDRVNRTFELTPIGQVYVEKALGKLKLEEEFQKELKRYFLNVSCITRIGVYQKCSPFLISGLMESFSSTYPDIQLCFIDGTSSLLNEQLLDGKLDYVIGCPPFPDSRLHCRPLHTDELLLVCPQNHPQASSIYYGPDQVPCLDIQPLNQETFFTTHPGQNLSSHIKKAFRKMQFQAPKIITLGSIETCIQSAITLNGFAFTLKSYIPQFREPYPVLYCRMNGEIIPAEFSLICLKKHKKEAFIPFLAQTTSRLFQEINSKSIYFCPNHGYDTGVKK